MPIRLEKPVPEKDLGRTGRYEWDFGKIARLQVV